MSIRACIGMSLLRNHYTWCNRDWGGLSYSKGKPLAIHESWSQRVSYFDRFLLAWVRCWKNSPGTGDPWHSHDAIVLIPARSDSRWYVQNYKPIWQMEYR